MALTVLLFLSYNVLFAQPQPAQELKTKQIAIQIGDTLVLNCPSETTPQWVGQFSRDQIVKNDQTLEIQRVTEWNSGEYFCKATYGDETIYRLIAEVYVGVRDDDRLNPKIIDVDKGMMVTFFCNSENETKWFFNRGPLPDNVEASPIERLLTIPSVQVSNDGIYTCFGRQGSSQGSQYFVAKSLLNVYDPSKIDPSEVVVQKDENIKLRCMDGISVHWTLSHGMLPFNAYQDIHNPNTLEIQKANFGNQGYYECEGYDTSGRAFKSRAHVTVEGDHEDNQLDIDDLWDVDDYPYSDDDQPYYLGDLDSDDYAEEELRSLHFQRSHTDCPTPDEVPNSEIKIVFVKDKKAARYKCKEGFRATSSLLRMCGKEGKWMGKAPACVSGASSKFQYLFHYKLLFLIFGILMFI